MNKHLFKCPECGYRNYVTKEDREELFDKLYKKDESKWFGENIKELIHNIKLLIPQRPPKK